MPQNRKTMFVPTLEDKGALKLFGNRFLKKCEGVSHFHSLPFQIQKEKYSEKRNTTIKRKENRSGSSNTLDWLSTI